MADKGICQRIQEHLDEIEAHMALPYSEKSEILENISNHVHDALKNRSGDDPSVDDLEAVLVEMDPPEYYGDGVSRPEPNQGSVPSKKRPLNKKGTVLAAVAVVVVVLLCFQCLYLYQRVVDLSEAKQSLRNALHKAEEASAALLEEKENLSNALRKLENENGVLFNSKQSMRNTLLQDLHERMRKVEHPPQRDAISHVEPVGSVEAVPAPVTVGKPREPGAYNAPVVVAPQTTRLSEKLPPVDHSVAGSDDAKRGDIHYGAFLSYVRELEKADGEERKTLLSVLKERRLPHWYKARGIEMPDTSAPDEGWMITVAYDLMPESLFAEQVKQTRALCEELRLEFPFPEEVSRRQFVQVLGDLESHKSRAKREAKGAKAYRQLLYYMEKVEREKGEERKELLEYLTEKRLPVVYAELGIEPPDMSGPEAEWMQVVVYDLMPDEEFEKTVQKTRTLAKELDTPLPENVTRRELLTYIQELQEYME